MSHPLRHLALLTALVLGISAAPCQAASAPAPPDAATTTCTQQLQAISRALTAYRRAHHGALPAHLSDLYPSYLKDKAMLHCPADPTPGTPWPADETIADPHMPVSYLYDMSADPATYPVTFSPRPDGKVTWYQQKMAQRAYFGDRVPVVRCWHHTQVPAGQTLPVLNLALTGKVFRTGEAWEYDADSVPFLLASLERDLAAGPERVRRRWTAATIADYFSSVPSVPALHDRFRAAAAKLASLAGSFSQDAAAQSAAVASLYGAAGDMEEAARAYDRALSLPGDHHRIAAWMRDQYFEAGQPEKGLMAVEKLQAREPHNVPYMVILAWSYGRAGQRDKADEWMHRADQEMIGQPAPDFTLNDAAGRTVRLADLRGRAVLLFFFSPNGDAEAVAKQLNSLRQQYRDRELTILGLDAWVGRQTDVAFAHRTFTYPLLPDAYPVFEAYGIYRTPTLILIDPEGKVATRHSGIDPDLAARLAEEVKKAIPSQAVAR
jgi:peroxiredoxin